MDKVKFDSKERVLTSAASVLVIALVALFERIFLNALFFAKFGWHAARVVEIWFYYGVAKGAFLISRLDPTRWVLRLAGPILPQHTYHMVILSGCVLMAITSILVFYLVKIVYGDEENAPNIAFVAAIIYASMINPLGMNLAAFLHDIVQLPVFMAALIAANSFWAQGKIFKKLLWGAVWLVSVVVGITVGPVIGIAMFISFAILALKGGGRKFGMAAFVLLVLMMFARFAILPAILGRVYKLAFEWRGIDVYSQIRSGSTDLLPLSFAELCKIYNVLLFFVPFGLIIAYKRREIIGLLLFATGLLVASIVSRGNRVLDIGVAMISSYAFLNWDKRWKFFNIGTLILITFIFISRTPLKFNYGLSIGGAGALLLWCGSNDRLKVIAPCIVVTALNLVLIGSTIRPRTTEAEYEAYRQLKGYAKDGGKILTTWSNGYFAEAVSGLKAATSPVSISEKFKKVYWENAKEARSTLKEDGVKYIVVTTKYIEIRRARIRVLPSLGFDPGKFSDFKNLKETFIYKMIYEPQSLSGLRRQFEFDDKATGEKVYVYEII